MNLTFHAAHRIAWLAASLIGISSIAAADENLLLRPQMQFLPENSIGITLDDALRIRDKDANTAAVIDIKKGEPIEIAFGFSGETVTPKRFRVKATGLPKDSVLLELLVSDQSAESGYLTLRDQPLRGSDSWQSYQFEPVAAKWMIVKISTFGEPVQFNVNELEVIGDAGASSNA